MYMRGMHKHNIKKLEGFLLKSVQPESVVTKVPIYGWWHLWN